MTHIIISINPWRCNIATESGPGKMLHSSFTNLYILFDNRALIIVLVLDFVQGY